MYPVTHGQSAGLRILGVNPSLWRLAPIHIIQDLAKPSPFLIRSGSGAQGKPRPAAAGHNTGPCRRAQRSTIAADTTTDTSSTRDILVLGVGVGLESLSVPVLDHFAHQIPPEYYAPSQQKYDGRLGGIDIEGKVFCSIAIGAAAAAAASYLV